MIQQELKKKKFIELVTKNILTQKDKQIILTLDNLNSICLKSEYLPHTHSEIYLFISYLISCEILIRIKNGQYLFNTKVAEASS